MKPSTHSALGLTARPSNWLGLCSITLCFLGAGHAMAQTWDGGGTLDSGNYNWADGLNWLADVAPVGGNSLTFAGTTNIATSFNNITAGTSFAGITFDNTAGAFTLSGNSITLGGNVVNNDAELQTINLNMLMSATRTFDTASGNILVGGILSGSGSIGLSKNGTNTLILTHANNYQGNTTINAGVLRAGNSSAFGSTGTISLANTDTVLELADGVTINRPLTALNVGTNKVVQLQNGATTGEYSGSIQINETDANNFDFFAFAGGTLTVSGQITTNGNANITKEGAGTVIVSGNNTGFTRGVTINAGVLRAGHNNAFGSSSGINLVNTDTVLELANGVTINRGLTFNNLATGGIINSDKKTLALQAGATAAEYSGGITINETTPGHVEVLVGSSGTLTISGAVNSTQAAGLTKTGAGTLILSNASNGYTGNTTVSAGRLTVSSTGTVNGSTAVSIGAGEFRYNSSTALSKPVSFSTTGGTLSGTGTITPTGTVNVTSGNTLAVGDGGIGTMSFGGALTIGGTYLYELNNTSNLGDLGDVAGNLTLGGILDLVQLGSYAAGGKFTLFAYDGTLSGIFTTTGLANIGDDTTFTDGGGIWNLNYNDTSAGLNGGVSASNTYVTITAIPEPSAAMLAGGLGVLALLRRRRA